MKFSAEPAELATLRRKSDLAVQTRVAKIDRLLTWPGKPGAKPEPVAVPLTAAEQTHFEAGRVLFGQTCVACHQAHGRGR